MLRTTLLSSLFALCLATSANAALHVDSTTTLTDAAGGTMVSHTTGDIGSETGSALSEASFLNFSPRQKGGSVNGNLSRTRERDGELITQNYSGNLSLVIPADGNGQEARTVTLQFDDVTVVRSEEGRTISGTLVINGREVPADEAPRSIIAILIGLVRLMQV
jgi:hypothetical protein